VFEKVLTYDFDEFMQKVNQETLGQDVEPTENQPGVENDL